ncbi:cold shock domain-containing protein [Pleionea sp. CnH1-48]|nr:cold shock domain-containing protein [Pleionea sp. CnH1-48]
MRSDDFSAPLFFHYSEIQLDGFKYLIKQQNVEFKARVTDDGKLQAIQVTPTELAPTQQRKIFNKES